MKSTFSVIYYLKRQVVKKDGTVPVMGRITVDGSQTQFSCKLTVDPKLWDTKGGRVTGRSTAALNERRKGFIDNSLGTKLLEKPVLNYYDNDSIEKGPYKMLVNCYENCFFTYNIIKVMLPKMAIKNTILFGLLLIFAYYGIKDNVVAIPFLQLFLSSLFLIELIYHIAFFFRLKNLCDKFKQIFSTPKSTKNKTIQDAIYMVLEYETTLAYNKSPNSNSVYKKLNNKLTEEWSCIKQNYDIR